MLLAICARRARVELSRLQPDTLDHSYTSFSTLYGDNDFNEGRDEMSGDIETAQDANDPPSFYHVRDMNVKPGESRANALVGSLAAAIYTTTIAARVGCFQSKCSVASSIRPRSMCARICANFRPSTRIRSRTKRRSPSRRTAR